MLLQENLEPCEYSQSYTRLYRGSFIQLRSASCYSRQTRTVLHYSDVIAWSSFYLSRQNELAIEEVDEACESSLDWLLTTV
jgi:hypothetical protein